MERGILVWWSVVKWDGEWYTGMVAWGEVGGDRYTGMVAWG